MKTKFYLNGKLRPLEEAAIPVMDRGFLYGDGVFESLRTYRGNPFLLDEHVQRLLQGSRTLKIKPPLSAEAVKSACLRTIAANNFKESYLKIILTRGMAKGHGLSPSNTAGRSTIIILVEELKPAPARPWKAIISRIRKTNNPTAKIKSLCYADNMLAKMEAEAAGADEAFMLDAKGNLAEGTVSNIFIVKNGVVYTPAAASPILLGITRHRAIKLAKKAYCRVVEKFLAPKDLYCADECFVTFSGAGIVPITWVQDKKIGCGSCGPITARLIKLCHAETKKV